MKRLSELLAATAARTIVTSTDPEIAGLHYDSRKAGAGDCFFAVRGTQCDGHAWRPWCARSCPPGRRRA